MGALRGASATPDCGRLRSSAAAETTGSAFVVPTLRRGGVFGLVADEEPDESEEEDVSFLTPRDAESLVVAEQGATDPEPANDARWLAAARTDAERGACWDDENIVSRELSSGLDAKRFDSAYRLSFHAVKGIETEPTIASENDCSHVAMAALSGCQTSADILSAVSSGDVRMRFTASSSLAFRNALKTIAPAAERRCELDFVLGRMSTPYTRPVASAVRDILRAHTLALRSLPQATVERRRAEMDDDVDSAHVSSSIADVTLLEVAVHTKRLRRQVDVIFGFLTDEKSLETHVLSHSQLLRRLETSLSHVDDGETPMIQYLYARSVKPIIDDMLSWMYRAAAPESSESFIECSPVWSVLRTFDECRVGGRAIPCWLGGAVHAGEDDDKVEQNSLELARVRVGSLPALALSQADDVLFTGLQLRILQRLPQTRAFARAVEGAFSSISSFEAHTERDARQWLNRMRLLESRIITLARESLEDMRAVREKSAREKAAAQADAIARSRAESIAREKARIDALMAVEAAKTAERQAALQELGEREKSRRAATLARIAEERAWLESQEAEHREAERLKMEKKMREKQQRLEEEDSKQRWFRWQNARADLTEKRKAFVRGMEAAQEQAAVEALADAMRDGVKIAPSRLVIEPFSSESHAVSAEVDGDEGEVDEADSEDFVDASEKFVDRSVSAIPMDSMSVSSDIVLEDAKMTLQDDGLVGAIEECSDSDIDVSISDGGTFAWESQATEIEYLGESFGAPLPLLINRELRTVIARQSVSIGRYIATVFLDHLALEAHLNAVLRFTLGGDLPFTDALLKNLRRACRDTKSQVTRTALQLSLMALENTIDDVGLRHDHFAARLYAKERMDVLVSFEESDLNLTSAFECAYSMPWPLNLVFSTVDEACALAETQNAMLQIRHSTVAVKEVSMLIHKSSKSRALMDFTKTSADLRARRLSKFSTMVTAFQHFVDALHGHIFEAVHVGEKKKMFEALRDEKSKVVPDDIRALCKAVETFCAGVHASCFLRPLDTALKTLIDDGLQLALDFSAVFASSDPDTLLEDGDISVNAQKVYAKFHALMTQLCFRARITSSESARGLVARLDFNEYYLSATIDLEF